jgi:hypothetical protein
MRSRASAAAKESLENGDKMHDETSLQTMLGFFGNPDSGQKYAPA